MPQPIRVTIWGENVHDRSDHRVRALYSEGMHATIASAIQQHLSGRVETVTATLEQPEQGLPDSLLAGTDVLTWWGHVAHADVSDDLVTRIQRRVLAGMGLLVLHSGHESKIFQRLMGTTCSLRWREADEREVVWTVNPSHEIAAGIPEVFVIPKQEMYGEFFDIPAPDELIFISSFPGGEVFRSGCCFRRGLGSIFYFSPGHETFPVYHQPEIRRILANAVKWAAMSTSRSEPRSSENSPTGWFEPQSR